MAKLSERDTDRYLKFHSETSNELGPGCYEVQSCFKSPKVYKATHATKRSPNQSPNFLNQQSPRTSTEGQNKIPFNSAGVRTNIME